MSMDAFPSVINAFSTLVIILDQHPKGAAAAVALLLSIGLAIAIAKRGKW